MKCKLCWRVTIAVFLTILAVEILILFFSARKFEQDKLDELAANGQATITALVELSPVEPSAKDLQIAGQRLSRLEFLRGASIYRNNGDLIAQFGEPTALEWKGGLPLLPQHYVEKNRFEIFWQSPSITSPFSAVLRLDSSAIPGKVQSFIFRVTGLVLLITLCTTLAAMLVLSRSVLNPLLRLRQQLLREKGRLLEPEAHLIATTRSDELGDVTEAINDLLRRLATGVNELKDRENALQRAHENLEEKVQDRTRKLTRLAQDLRREMSRRQQAQLEFEQASQFSEDNPNPVLRVSKEGELLYANQASDLILKHWQINIGDQLPSPWRAMTGDVFDSGKSSQFELSLDHQTYELTFYPANGKAYVHLFGLDISRGKDAEQRLRHLAYHDALTGLPNRSLFLDRLNQDLTRNRTGRTTAVLLVDLDHFKDINDALGHLTGNMLLQQVAERLQGCLTTTDTLARIGGDEFGIIQANPLDANDAATFAQKLLETLSRPLHIDGHDHHINASIGISVFPGDADQAEQLLLNAEMAMYRAKKQRGDYRFFVGEMQDNVQRYKTLERDIRLAIDNDQFELYYQPKLNLKQNQVLGLEALVRWNHPVHGFLSPAEFIPVAEQSKLIIPMGEQLLQKACRQIALWSKQGLPPRKVAVNLSAVQFSHSDLPSLIKKVLWESAIAPECLELEITESVAMEGADNAVRTFNELAAIGVSLAIDDFGTGYSSLAYLRDFPVHRVKIDKAFVDDLGTDLNQGAIAQAVTMMSHSFGMEVTAEGVESTAQLNYLKKLGCDEIQGYYFSKPLPAEQVTAFLKEH
ncbi:bifunctional diguanylate cyclase/phosphodiesterase [Motiliproteus sp. MSK22-1]|uniref:putative bifunctional diguanylate cyclase/phosphodiesterase n=1 Tax=Motiliproteus sp. MSK22-1 TaxID=1897630 RepID=UPI000977B8CF|nr:EAL domain-containing protein [Motiliproteus sp. MSK22-1]OMH32073.1 hypothetical protein BGP75_15300 [Motiliproteus sp. MSK22-1]